MTRAAGGGAGAAGSGGGCGTGTVGAGRGERGATAGLTAKGGRALGGVPAGAAGATPRAPAKGDATGAAGRRGGATGTGGATGGATGSGAAGAGLGAASEATGGGASTATASGRATAAGAPTANTVAHTEQRARTPPAGTFAGSIRNTVSQPGHVAFNLQPAFPSATFWRRSSTNTEPARVFA